MISEPSGSRTTSSPSPRSCSPRRPHVDPRQDDEARVLGRFLADEVVVRALPEGIRQGEQVQQREPVAVQPMAGMMLPGKHPAPPAVTLHASEETGSLTKIRAPLSSNVSEKLP